MATITFVDALDLEKGNKKKKRDQQEEEVTPDIPEPKALQYFNQRTYRAKTKE